MRRSNKETALTILGIVTLLLVAVGTTMIPELFRYLKIRSM